MSKVILEGFIIVPEPDLIAVQAELINHKRLTMAEPGCLVFEVVQCTINPYRFNVYEEFIDRDAFERHQARVKSSAWDKVSANIERHYSQQSAG
ncbi:putative quinol monooxygenase [Vreelandella boliviensis]|uniref:putative quinol monooxygenase n=1 Tax=Vreelandella boliviensis TaxID=223527 RepID=UPI001B8B0DF2|nr:antibiotic biosynthesis monooxygenase [Halomonas boliviensis]MBS3669214.1 antibiotic biosynthesis monooxygenase [Halomonas boliviensis]